LHVVYLFFDIPTVVSVDGKNAVVIASGLLAESIFSGGDISESSKIAAVFSAVVNEVQSAKLHAVSSVVPRGITESGIRCG